MNVKQSWRRHGEEVKDAAVMSFEFFIYITGILSPFILMWLAGFNI